MRSDRSAFIAFSASPRTAASAASAVVMAMVVVAASASAATAGQGVCPRIVPRDEWGARLPKQVAEMQNPVSTVVIHHTYIPSQCDTNEACVRAMKSMQVQHQDANNWDDIGYSFVVGGDGRVYKGRGWNRVGAHAPPFNADSVGISLIGDFSETAPPQAMLDAVQWLIRCGVDTGRIAADYQLIGHRQAKANHTACPGDALFNVIQTWEKWTETPRAPGRHPASRHYEVASDAPLAAAPELQTPAAAAGMYDPSTPNAERDAVEVRPLNKRSLWDRLVTIWQKEAMRQAAVARQEAALEELAALEVAS